MGAGCVMSFLRYHEQLKYSVGLNFEMSAVLRFDSRLVLQVEHYSWDRSDFVGGSLQGKTCSVLEAVGIRASFGHWCVILLAYCLIRVLMVLVVPSMFESSGHRGLWYTKRMCHHQACPKAINIHCRFDYALANSDSFLHNLV